jgi:hypothetical protein
MKLWIIWDIKRFMIHVPAGLWNYLIAVIVFNLLGGIPGAIVSAAIILGGIAVFIYYEHNEDKIIEDCAFKDTQGFLAGIYAAPVIHALIVFLK